jgi:hypothetical protein
MSRTGSKRVRIVVGVIVVVVIVVAALLLYQYQQGSGMKETTVTLNGSTYYSTTVPVLWNLTTLTFKGIVFSFTLGLAEQNFAPYTRIQGMTGVTVPCPPGTEGGIELCTEFLPQIQVSFPDGSVEYFNKATVVNTSVTYERPTSYPWFSIHTDPRVAIMLNTNAPTASLTLYVST